MKKLLFGLCALALFSAVSCKKDAKTTSLTVNFEPQFGAAPFDLAKTYTFNTIPLRFDLFTVYLSDITLVKTDGTTKVLSEIEYLPFSSPTSSSYAQSRTYEGVEIADYTAVRLGIGVKSSLNKANPSNYNAPNPLAETGSYWPDWNSYIFMRIQAMMDTNGDGILNKPLVYHIGSDVTYREIALDKAFSVGENGSIQINFDIKDLLTMNGQPFDIIGFSATPHAAGNTSLAETLMDNITNMVHLK